MNKHIMKVLEKYDFTYDGNYGTGTIDGYEVNIYNNPRAVGPVFFFSTYLSQTNKSLFITKLNSYKYSMVQVGLLDYGVAIIIGSATGGTFEKKGTRVLGTIIELLNELDAKKKDTCPITGEIMDETNSRYIILPDTKCKVRLTNTAIDTINTSIENANEDYQQANNNYLKGFFGIVIGAIVGVIVSVILSLLGIVAAISSAVSIWLGVFLYRKFGGKPNAVMIVMSLVTTTIFILGSVWVSYILLANSFVKSDGLTYSGIEAFKYYMNNYFEFKSIFFRELGLAALFIGIGEACTIGSLVKAVRRPKKLE